MEKPTNCQYFTTDNKNTKEVNTKNTIKIQGDQRCKNISDCQVKSKQTY